MKVHVVGLYNTFGDFKNRNHNRDEVLLGVLTTITIRFAFQIRKGGIWHVHNSEVYRPRILLLIQLCNHTSKLHCEYIQHIVTVISCAIFWCSYFENHNFKCFNKYTWNKFASSWHVVQQISWQNMSTFSTHVM